MAPFSSLRLLRPPFERTGVDVWPLAKRSSTSLSRSARTHSHPSPPSTPTTSAASELSEPRRMRRVVSLNETTSSACAALTAATTMAAVSQPRPLSQPPTDALSRARAVQRHVRASMRADATRQLVHGFVRVPWILGLRHGRLLTLNGRQLTCLDVGAQRVFWRARVEGARVRVHLAQCKVVLSKLESALVLQFWAPDELSTRRWAAALLRASATAPPKRS